MSLVYEARHESVRLILDLKMMKRHYGIHVYLGQQLDTI